MARILLLVLIQVLGIPSPLSVAMGANSKSQLLSDRASVYIEGKDYWVFEFDELVDLKGCDGGNIHSRTDLNGLCLMREDLLGTRVIFAGRSELHGPKYWKLDDDVDLYSAIWEPTAFGRLAESIAGSGRRHIRILENKIAKDLYWKNVKKRCYEPKDRVCIFMFYGTIVRRVAWNGSEIVRFLTIDTDGFDFQDVYINETTALVREVFGIREITEFVIKTGVFRSLWRKKTILPTR